MLMHKGTQEINIERLKLRKFQLEDAEQMFYNYANDHRVTRFLSWKPYENIEDVKLFLSQVIAAYADNDYYHWVIEYNGEVVGSISAISIDEKNLLCEVGYCIGYHYWKQGITSEALKAVMQFFFTEVTVERIIAKHDIENPGSGGVMKKCGMTYEGRLREHYLRNDGTRADAMVYGILKREF